jgi:uncharacterized protein
MKIIKNRSDNKKTARYVLISAALAAVAVLSGCATYSNAVVGMDTKIRCMDIPGASADALKKFDKSNGNRDQLVTTLELGSLSRMYAMYGTNMTLPGTCYTMLKPEHPYYLMESDPESLFKLSIKQIEDADNTFEYWDNQPDSSTSEQMGALLTNQTFTAYRGTYSERIMAQTYLALDFMQIGDMDSAGTALRKMHYYQTSAIERNAKDLKETDELSQDAMNGSDPNAQGNTYDVSKAKSDPKVQRQLDAQYSGLRNLAPYGDFANPFSYWLEAVYLMHCAESGDDLENARKNLQYVYGITGQSDDLALLKQAEEACDTKKAPEGVTYVIFESGEAPIYAEVQIEIPLNVVDPTLPYVAAAFPKLVLREDGTPSFYNVEADGVTAPSHQICSMDRVIGEEFNRRFPIILTKAMISAGVKGAISYAIKKSSQNNNNDWTALLVSAVVDITNMALNQADTRSWHTLPKEFSVVQIKTPESRVIHVSEPNSMAAPLEIKLNDGPVNVVVVRQICGCGTMIYSQFVLARNK